MTDTREPLLRIEGLTVDLPSHADRPHAVQDLSLTLHRDEILCVVGESGSGKSVMSRAVLGLFPTRHVRPSAGRMPITSASLLAWTRQGNPSQLLQRRQRLKGMLASSSITPLGA